jgi:hypothetical protein
MSNLVQNEQTLPSPAVKQLLCAFCCTCKQGEQQKYLAYVRESCEENKETIAFLVWRFDKEQTSFGFGTRYTQAMMGGCLLAPLLAFSSLPPSFFLFSLSPLLLSPFCFQKPIWGRAC